MLDKLPEFTQLIDGSHKYTDVFTDGYVGPGNAHHNYLIRQKPVESDGLVQSGPPFVYIRFQDGPIKESGVNGVMDENLLAIVIDRLQGFQSGKFACEENQRALDFIQLGLQTLQLRTQNREKRGVEGTHKI